MLKYNMQNRKLYFPNRKRFFWESKLNMVKIHLSLSNLYTLLMSKLRKKLKFVPQNSENAEGIITVHLKLSYNN